MILITATFFTACATVAREDAMQADVDQATAIIERYEAIPEAEILPAVMRAARGLAILNSQRPGSLGSVRGDTGVVVQRTDKIGAVRRKIGTGGVGAGFQAGLRYPSSYSILRLPVEAFAKGGNVSLRGAVGVTAGPVGTAEVP